MTEVPPQAVVLAGGLGTRMHPRTQRVPKSMLEVAGRPFIDWQLELLARSGIREVVLCIAHLGGLIQEHVGDGARLGVSVRYAMEPPGQLLGTAGALRAAVALLAPRFVVTYGDSYLPFDYGEPLRLLERHADCEGVMAVYRNAGRFEPSNVVTDGAWVLRYQKHPAGPEFDHIDYGATALRREVVEALPPGLPLGLDQLQEDLAARGRLRALLVRERFFQIGSPAGWADLDHHLRSSR
ncbi:MAG TPA: sugar phosphate nucleotidyltransferase [Myxococcaceae bacterium]|nr:sugar phosphate nucleotidyltransferase [Myxococcaceae bacterium]